MILFLGDIVERMDIDFFSVVDVEMGVENIDESDFWVDI